MLSDDEVKWVRQIAEWFEEGRQWVPREDAMSAMELEEVRRYEPLIKRMEAIGAIDEVRGTDQSYATSFAPSSCSVDLVREIELREKTAAEAAATAPDFVDQIKTQFRTNPITDSDRRRSPIPGESDH